MTEIPGWEEYYQTIKGRAPRQLLLDTLAYFSNGPGRTAIDLGCGDGTETAVLLERGWNVVAIDGEPVSLSHLLAKIPQESRARLQTQVMKFEEVHLSPADLIHASLSLPFCPPEHFDALWRKIVQAVSGPKHWHVFTVIARKK